MLKKTNSKFWFLRFKKAYKFKSKFQETAEKFGTIFKKLSVNNFHFRLKNTHKSGFPLERTQLSSLLASGCIKSDIQRSFSFLTYFLLHVLTSLYHVKPSYFFCIEACKSDYKILIPAWAARPKCALQHSPRTLA